MRATLWRLWKWPSSQFRKYRNCHSDKISCHDCNWLLETIVIDYDCSDVAPTTWGRERLIFQPFVFNKYKRILHSAITSRSRLWRKLSADLKATDWETQDQEKATSETAKVHFFGSKCSCNQKHADSLIELIFMTTMTEIQNVTNSVTNPVTNVTNFCDTEWWRVCRGMYCTF